MSNSWLLVILLAIVALLNYLDRQVIFSLLPLLRGDLHLTDTQLGLLGATFLWVYAFCSLFAGWMAQKFGHRKIILASLCAWSGVTLLTGLSTGFVSLAATRAAIAEMRNQDFVQTLRAKGLSEFAVIRHVIKNALPGVLAVMGLQFGYLLGGSILVETVFTWPGSGFLLSKAIINRDVPVLQGTILTLAIAFVMTNLIIDLLQSMIDPRIRRG